MSEKTDEQEKKELFAAIANSDTPDMSTIDNVPFLFHGLKTADFGLSSFLHENPFFKLRDIALNPQNSWDDRTNSIRYMQRIPHINRDENCISATLSVVNDHQYPFRDRYHFFSNNDKIIKLCYEIVNPLHAHVYEKFDTLAKPPPPLLYKILSAQYILTQFPVGTYDIDGVQTWLKSICEDEEMSIHYRSECADILSRAGYGKYIQYGRDVISKLGDLYDENKRQTIYSNLQNVHNETITKSIIDTLHILMDTVRIPENANTGDIYERLLQIVSDSQQEKVTESFQRVIIDTGKYEGLVMSDILLLVWEKIKSSGDNSRNDMEKRLVEELYDMNETCSSGHLSRIINVLSGFCDISPVKISIVDQLKTNVFARYATFLKSLGAHEQEAILNEMSSNEKYTIEDFIASYSPREELRSEFVPDYLDDDTFDRVYTQAERCFFGY